MLSAILPAVHIVAAAWVVEPGVGMQSFLQEPLVGVQIRVAPDTNWSDLYRTDLDSLRAFIAANHPGAADSKNPEFSRTLVSAYEEALRDTGVVNSYGAYAVALARFGNRFQDAHLTISGTRPIDGIREAGIYPAYRGGAFIVAWADGRYGPLASALTGATVLGCGREDAAQVFTTRVLSWRGRPAIEADWIRWAPLLFTDYGPPIAAAPTTCRFGIGDRVVEIPLQWRTASSRDVRQRQADVLGITGRSLGVERLDGGTIWVNLPTFAVNDEEGIAAMTAMLDSLRAALKTTPRWSLLVFDLRENQGGSSRWGDDIARTVFGKRWLDKAHAWLSDGAYVEWRVSPYNLTAIEGIIEQLATRHGTDSDEVKGMRALHASMMTALERGDSLYGVPHKRRGVKPPAPARLPGRIVLLTSASCFSACLDFMDRMRLHPAAVHAGQTTGVDTDYMENWGTRLPSGLVAIGYPMKVYRNRRRAHNEAYEPALRYEGAIENTEAVREWLARRIGGEP